MNFNVELARKLVEAVFSEMPEDYQFGPQENYECEPVNLDNIIEAVCRIDVEAKVRYGISKLVIISQNLGNYVIKIPFNGMYIESDEEDEIYHRSNSYASNSYAPPVYKIEWCDYSNADSLTGWNYCDAEWRKYCNLKAVHLDCFVSKTYPFVTVKGFKCFIQEVAIAKRYYEDEEDEGISEKSFNKAKSLNDEYDTYIDAAWLALCVEKFGAGKVEKFLKYVTTIDAEIINDLHGGNYGVRPNGTPCILDFASFESQGGVFYGKRKRKSMYILSV